MKKISIAVVVVLAVAALAAPFGCGMMMERIVRETFDNMNKRYADTGHDVSAEIVRFDRGYASSEIEWKIKFGRLKALYNVDEVVFIDRAEHGLSGIISKTSLEKNLWYTDFVKNKLGGKDPLQISTKYNFTGGIETTVAVDAFNLQMENQTVAVKPGRVVVAGDKDFKQFTSDASWEGMVVAEQFSLGVAALKSSLTMMSSFIWDGNVTMTVKNAHFQEGGENIDLTNMKLEYVLHFDKEANKLSAKAEYGVEGLQAGPDKVSNVFARLGINGVDAKGYEEFMKLYTATVSSILGDINNAKNDPEKMKQVFEKKMTAVGFQLVAAGEKLLTRGLELQISDLHLQLPDGEIKGDITVSLLKDMTFAQFIPVAGQPALALEIIALKSNINLPEKLVGDAPMLFVPMYPGMQSGLFVKEGSSVLHKAETKDGKLLLNGKEVLL